MRLAPPLALAILASLAPTASLPVAAECTGQVNRFPPFAQVAPTAELVVIGTVTEPLRGHDGAAATFRLRVDEVLRGQAPETIDILGLTSGLPLRGSQGCRQDAFVYARVGDVIALALEGTLDGRPSINTVGFIEGRPDDLVRAGWITREEALAAVGPTVDASPAPGVLTGRAASDAFWQPLLQGGERAGVEDVFAAADLIVLGSLVELRQWPPDPAIPGGTDQEHLLRIEIEDVLKGTPISSEPGFIDLHVGPLTGTTLEEVNARLPPGERSLFLLYNLGERNHLHGQSAEEVAATRDVYTRILDHTSVIRNLDGLAYSIVPPPTDDFPAEYQGSPFSTLERAVRRAANRAVRHEARAASSPAPSPVPSPTAGASPVPG